MAKAKSELGDCGRAREAPHVFREHRSRAHDVESAQRIQIATGLCVELCDTLGKEIERGPESPSGSARALGQHAAHAAVARDETQDAGGLEVVEGVEDDGVGSEDCHTSK